MCHYVVPARRNRLSRGNATEPGNLDGRFADDAVAMFLWHIERTGTRPVDYQAKIIGGGNQFSRRTKAAGIEIPRLNIEVGLELLEHHGFQLTGRHVGGDGPRQVALQLSSGQVWVRHDPELNEGESR